MVISGIFSECLGGILMDCTILKSKKTQLRDPICPKNYWGADISLYFANKNYKYIACEKPRFFASAVV